MTHNDPKSEPGTFYGGMMKVLITGATGLVGRQLCLELFRRGINLAIVGRSSEESFREKFSLPCQYYTWDHLKAIGSIDAVFHLAGDPIASRRWTRSKKKAILNSRVETTQALAKAFLSSGHWPKTFISASAIGYYGDRSSELLSEESSPGEGFLSHVCQKWEEVTTPFESHSRVVKLRIGIVLDCLGGFLEPMEQLFSSYLGGRVGNGKQWMSWIHSQDLVQIMLFALENISVKGTLNAVSPKPVTNREWTSLYAKQLRVPAIFHAPSFALKLLLGEMSQLALASQNVSAEKLLNLGFPFQYTDLEQALANLYQWKSRPAERIFSSNQWISREREEIFPFFSAAKNLERITPPLLNFKVLRQSTDKIQEGTLIDYRLKVHGLPLKWRTEIKEWNPPSHFIDTQLKGPYKHWHHTHSFTPMSQGTLMEDRVIYELPFSQLGQLLAGSFVRKDIEKIFNHRTKVIHQIQKVPGPISGHNMSFRNKDLLK